MRNKLTLNDYLTINKEYIRLLILDISNTYTKILDERYVYIDDEKLIRNKYSDSSKYLVIRTM